MIRKSSLCSLTVLFFLYLSTVAYPFGGSPPPAGTGVESPIQQNNTETERQTDLDKARAEMVQEKAELSKVEQYMWNLDSRITDARKTGNTKKMLELKQLEQDTIERARLITGSINRKKEKFPELKAAEAVEAARVNQPQIQTQDSGDVVEVVMIPRQAVAASPKSTAKKAVKPPMPPMPSASGNVEYFYHEVDLGDTLYSISRKYYGTPAYYKEIVQNNKIANMNGLKQGMMLKMVKRSSTMIQQQEPVQIQQESQPQPVINPDENNLRL
jgi:LysM repeat protein